MNPDSQPYLKLCHIEVRQVSRDLGVYDVGIPRITFMFAFFQVRHFFGFRWLFTLIVVGFDNALVGAKPVYKLMSNLYKISWNGIEEKFCRNSSLHADIIAQMLFFKCDQIQLIDK